MRTEIIIDLRKERIENFTNGTEVRLVITSIDEAAHTSVEDFIRSQQKGRDAVLAYVAACELHLETWYTWREFQAKYEGLCSTDQFYDWQRKGVDEPKWIRQVNAIKRDLRNKGF